MKRQQLLRMIYAFAAIIVVGTGGYMAIGGWSLLDTLYMTVITITTVGAVRQNWTQRVFR